MTDFDVHSRPIKAKKENEAVNHPSHYNQRQFETIEEMIIVFGRDAVIDFCRINAWKYKTRAPFKGKLDEDLKKADWYINKVKELSEENSFEKPR